ncbi:tol-pal system protein YbgF [candidate division KSB1 bacterium]|nr:tol-pal system protein YbgF [candidate division KSB1 bacterium]
MRATIFKITTIILISLALSSCATRKEVVRFKEDLSYLRVQTESLRLENAELKKMLLELNKSFDDLQNETRRTKADVLTEIDNVKSQSQVIDSKLEDTSYRMSHFLQKAESVTNPPPAQTDSLNSASSQDKPAIPSVQKNDFDPLAIYNSAYLDLSKGNYQLAMQGFQQFLEKFPQSDLADNAQYWLGEVFYAQKENQKAIDEFKKVVENYPRGDKVAAALLKIGYCHFNLGDQATGKKFMKIVTERFPNTEEARLARSRL